MERTKENNLMYFLKTIACFMVICIHQPFEGVFGQSVIYIARFAAPFFFMVSGYFTYNSDVNVEYKKIASRMQKQLNIFLLGVILYGLIKLGTVLYQGSILEWIQIIVSPKALFELLILNYTTPYFGAGHLWYLMSILYVYAIYRIIRKYNKYEISCVFSIVVLIGVLCLELYIFINQITISEIWYRNFFAQGLPFFLIGTMIRKYEKKLVSPKIIGGGLAGVFLSFGVEIFLLPKTWNLYLSSILLAIFCVLISIKYPALMNRNIFTEIGKRDSGNIYIIHDVFTKLFRALDVAGQALVWSYLLPFIVFLLAIGVSELGIVSGAACRTKFSRI